MLFDFGTGDSNQQKEPVATVANIAQGKLVQIEGQIEQKIMGVPVVTKSGTLFKRALPDINFEIAKSDDLETPDELAEALAKSSDLIEGVYEGFKFF